MTAAAVLWFAALLTAAEAPALLPLQSRGDPAFASQVKLRGRHALWLWAQRPGERITLRLKCVRVGRYTSPLEAVFTVDDKPAAKASAEPGQTAELSFTAPKAGLLRVEATAGSNCFVVASGPRHLGLEASVGRPLHMLGAGELYFFVPPAAQRFSVVARGQGRSETAKITVVSPTGAEVASAEALGGSTARAEIVAPQPSGRVWKLVVSKASEGTLEDVTLYLSGDVAPFVALTPASALVPFCYGLQQQPRLIEAGRKPQFTVGITSADIAKTHRLRATVKRGGRSLGSFTSQPGQTRLTVRLPSADDAAYAVAVDLLDPNGKVRMSAATEAEVRNGVLYVGGLRPILSVAISAPKTPAEPVTATLELALVGADANAVDISATLYRCDIPNDPTSPDATKVAEEPRLPRNGGRWTARSPAPMTEGAYEWLFIARNRATGRPLVWQRAHWVVFRDRVFPERAPAPAVPPPAALTAARAPVVLAAPASRDAPTYGYLPSQAEVAAPVAISAARGQSCAAVAVAVATRDIRRVTAAVSDLVGPAGARIPAAAVDVRLARYWAQRTSWHSGDCWVIPELLERRASWPMRALQPAVLWLTVRVPRDARPGTYRATLTVTADGSRSAKPVELTVYPFELAEPKEYHWGLYTDSGRWRRYSKAKVMAEMRDYRAHGITSLMMYPLTHSTVELGRDGRPKINAAEFVGYMDMAKRAGLRPPTVLSFQSLAGLVSRLLGPDADQKTWDRLYADIALYYAGLARERRWGEVVFHAIDEPTFRYKTGDNAIHWLGILKRAGLTTFTTALDPKLVNGPLDPYLDVRCWSVGYVLGSKEANARARADAQRSGDRLWYYGSGSYTGQEGRMYRNRWICGFGLWISGAEGEWSWTFLRPKDSAFNDFDGARHREAKDAMTAYPSQGDAPPTPTPQWEGIREGIIDFTYMYTARKLAQKVGGAKGRRALAELEKLTAELPWGVAPVEATPQNMDAWRARAAQIIRSLLR